MKNKLLLVVLCLVLWVQTLVAQLNTVNSSLSQSTYTTVGYLQSSINPQYQSIQDNTVWHYIAVTKNGLNGKIYLDGNLLTDSNFSNQPFIWNSLLLGATQGCVSCVPVPNFYGQIDDLRISNIERSSTQVMNYFNSNQPFNSDANTIGLYNFDTSSDNTLLNSGIGNNGILYGGVNYSSGKFGQALSFDGIDDYARISQSLPTNTITIEFWFKSTDTNATMAQFEYAYNTSISLQTFGNSCETISGSLTNGLVAYYPFCGNANDESGNGNNGVATNVTWGTDRFGNTNSTAEFNGDSSRYLSVTNPSNFTGTKKTFSVWIKFPTTLSSGLYYNQIFGGGTFWFQIYGNYPTYVSNGYTYKLGFNGSNTFISNYLFNTNTWEHIVYTIDGDLGQVSLYINGNYAGSQSISNFSTNDWSSYYIGSSPNLNSQNIFAGQIDDFGIWNRALTQQEITNLYNNVLNTNSFVNTESTITVYPNPTNSNISIDTSNQTDLIGSKIIIINTLGQEIYKSILSQQIQDISLSSITTSGLYFVSIIDNSGKTITTKKIVLQ
ncbi:LamG-like jellyroll fold domain-containing protein [uncultured Flavobacterium sp.]|uniref:LamG-like jellyroll fold domain-containing protein n=1 Tax=uncultured Flavobacterium sp. TaxID=165435 RepID=UPI002618B3DC|nr:LamG-like jellyroll fold domain-containing protein [uncultured Flavobacterium sp.]